MGPNMGHLCGPDSCMYESACYSSGAIQDNDGACQECSGGKWVSATGCATWEHGMPCEHGMMGKKGKPCPGKRVEGRKRD